jgi:hypothetical protein
VNGLDWGDDGRLAYGGHHMVVVYDPLVRRGQACTHAWCATTMQTRSGHTYTRRACVHGDGVLMQACVCMHAGRRDRVHHGRPLRHGQLRAVPPGQWCVGRGEGGEGRARGALARRGTHTQPAGPHSTPPCWSVCTTATHLPARHPTKLSNFSLLPALSRRTQASITHCLPVQLCLTDSLCLSVSLSSLSLPSCSATTTKTRAVTSQAGHEARLIVSGAADCCVRVWAVEPAGSGRPEPWRCVAVLQVRVDPRGVQGGWQCTAVHGGGGGGGRGGGGAAPPPPPPAPPPPPHPPPPPPPPRGGGGGGPGGGGACCRPLPPPRCLHTHTHTPTHAHTHIHTRTGPHRPRDGARVLPSQRAGRTTRVVPPHQHGR